jgi:ABC-type polysaccharide/polyol phosphate export permease
MHLVALVAQLLSCTAVGAAECTLSVQFEDLLCTIASSVRYRRISKSIIHLLSTATCYCS